MLDRCSWFKYEEGQQDFPIRDFLTLYRSLAAHEREFSEHLNLHPGSSDVRHRQLAAEQSSVDVWPVLLRRHSAEPLRGLPLACTWISRCRAAACGRVALAIGRTQSRTPYRPIKYLNRFCRNFSVCLLCSLYSLMHCHIVMYIS